MIDCGTAVVIIVARSTTDNYNWCCKTGCSLRDTVVRGLVIMHEYWGTHMLPLESFRLTLTRRTALFEKEQAEDDMQSEMQHLEQLSKAAIEEVTLLGQGLQGKGMN